MLSLQGEGPSCFHPLSNLLEHLFVKGLKQWDLDLLADDENIAWSSCIDMV